MSVDIRPGGLRTVKFSPKAARSVNSVMARVQQRHVFWAIIVLAIALRCWELAAVGFNSDEAVYAGQAASIAGQEAYLAHFPIFRAHPLLFQGVLSVFYQFGVSDIAGRLLSAAFGVGTVAVVYALGRLLYGARAGLVAMLLLAVMPYHVLVTRQVLLDGPMVFFATASLYLVARFCLEQQGRWLVAAAAVLGLSVLTKETAVVLVGSAVVFFLLSTSVRLRTRTVVVACAVLLLVVLTFPAAIRAAGATKTGGSYLAWQLARRANHPFTFYVTTVPPALGIVAILTAILGLVLGRRLLTWREGLLLAWAAVPVVFFTIMPIKGFQYLLPLSPVVAVLAARALTSGIIWARLTRDRVHWRAKLTVAASAVVVISLLVPTWGLVQPPRAATFLAGSGGLPGGREVGGWIDDNLPKGAQILTLGPSMGNVISFYGHRQTWALSVSPNPLNRNPSYTPVENPDLQLRKGHIQYVAWDAFSAGRSPNFSAKLLAYVRKYRGVAVHTYSVGQRRSDGSEIEEPVIIVYELRP